LFRFYTETESFDVSIELKQTEDPPKQFKREYIWVFFKKFRVVSVCFGLLRNSSVCFGCFDIGSKHRNKPKLFAFGFTKQTETNAKQILFRFVSVRTEIYFCLFRGHPNPPHCPLRGLAPWRIKWSSSWPTLMEIRDEHRKHHDKIEQLISKVNTLEQEKTK
jgi:hypothetical protein